MKLNKLQYTFIFFTHYNYINTEFFTKTIINHKNYDSILANNLQVTMICRTGVSPAHNSTSSTGSNSCSSI